MGVREEAVQAVQVVGWPEQAVAGAHDVVGLLLRQVARRMQTAMRIQQWPRRVRNG